MKKIVKWTSAYLFIGFFVVIILSQIKKDNIWYPYYEIKEFDSILINDIEYTDVKIQNFSFSQIKKGDCLEFYFELEDLGIKQPMVTFLIFHCNVKAYDNGELMYEYGWEEGRRMAPSGIHRIPLQNSKEHRIRICLEVAENHAFTSIDTIEVHESSIYFKEFLRQNASDVGIGVFMIAVGVLVPLIIIAVGKLGIQYRKALWISAFCILAGIWMECDVNLMQFYIEDLYLVSELKYISLYLCMLPLLMFSQETIRNKKKSRIIRKCTVIYGVLAAIVFAQHFMGIYTLSSNLVNFQILAIGCIGTLFFIAITECSGEGNSERVFCQGLSVLSCFICLELIRFNVSKFLFENNQSLKFSFVYFAFLVFIVIMLHSYVMSFIEYFSEQRKLEVLEKLSSVDMLTDLATRVHCSKEIKKLEERGQKNFTVILFDLNYLKHINERYGNEMGDGYIYEFAQILRNAFEDCYLVGRMGGDEFMVVLEAEDMAKEREYLKLVQTYTKAYNEKNTIQISYAVGSASSTKQEPVNFWKVYDLADDRMHESKKREKANK